MINGIDYAYLWEHEDEYERLKFEDLDNEAVLKFCEALHEDVRKAFTGIANGLRMNDPSDTPFYEVCKDKATFRMFGESDVIFKEKKLKKGTHVTVLNRGEKDWRIKCDCGKGKGRSEGIGLLDKNALTPHAIAEANRMLEYLRSNLFDALTMNHGRAVADYFLKICPEKYIGTNKKGEKMFVCAGKDEGVAREERHNIEAAVS